MSDPSERTLSDEQPLAAAVPIDGGRARGIREAKRLTQLYVANVVGVTTDTISRWENNRYPTIKRENALKLAEALEVPLADLLRNDSEAASGIPPEDTFPDAAAAANELPAAPPSPANPLPATPPRRHWLAIAITAGLLVVVAGLWLLQNAGPAATALRRLPPHAAPGSIVPVELEVTLQRGDQRGIIVKERLPEGWRLVATQPTGSTPGGSEAKWILPAGAGTTHIAYAVQLPAKVPLGSSGSFQGSIVTGEGERSRSRQVEGDMRLAVAPHHWADRNGDDRIDDSEIMPAYWLTEELKGLPLDWAFLEAAWNGQGYSWSAGQGFQPRR